MAPYRGQSPVLGWSLHMTGEWKAQSDRVARWHGRATRALTEDDQLDFLLAFFENSFALRDWLIDTDIATVAQLEALFAQHVELRINRDLANSFKHHSITRPSQERPPCLCREYAPERPAFGEDCRLIVLSEGVKYDALELAATCLGIWQGFIAKCDSPSQ